MESHISRAIQFLREALDKRDKKAALSALSSLYESVSSSFLDRRIIDLSNIKGAYARMVRSVSALLRTIFEVVGYSSEEAGTASDIAKGLYLYSVECIPLKLKARISIELHEIEEGSIICYEPLKALKLIAVGLAEPVPSGLDLVED